MKMLLARLVLEMLLAIANVDTPPDTELLIQLFQIESVSMILD